MCVTAILRNHHEVFSCFWEMNVLSYIPRFLEAFTPNKHWDCDIQVFMSHIGLEGHERASLPSGCAGWKPEAIPSAPNPDSEGFRGGHPALSPEWRPQGLPDQQGCWHLHICVEPPQVSATPCAQMAQYILLVPWRCTCVIRCFIFIDIWKDISAQSAWSWCPDLCLNDMCIDSYNKIQEQRAIF